MNLTRLFNHSIHRTLLTNSPPQTFLLSLSIQIQSSNPKPNQTQTMDASSSSSSTPITKPKILLAASGSVAAIKFESLCRSFQEWAEVKAVVTKSALHFIDRKTVPSDVVLYTDEEEWASWSKIGDEVLHIELRKWADVLVVAPLSANTLAKIAGGLCDNLLTCIIRAWDYSKPLYVAPAMNTFMWSNPFTERHISVINELGISVIPPITKRLACGDYGNGAMAEPSEIYNVVTIACRNKGIGGKPSLSN